MPFSVKVDFGRLEKYTRKSLKTRENEGEEETKETKNGDKEEKNGLILYSLLPLAPIPKTVIENRKGPLIAL